MEFISYSFENTLEIGARISALLHAGDVVELVGELGAGKTALTKGIAKGLGVSDEVTSPTYTLMNSYEDGRLPLYHFDLYRLRGEEELNELGLDEFLYGNGVCVIEWSVVKSMPRKPYIVNIETVDATTRRIEIDERLGI